MDFEGKFIQKLDEESGTSKATGNPWRRAGWVFETFGQYPKKVMVMAFNDRIDQFNNSLTLGQDYVVSVDAESREFNGRWYTDLRLYAVRPAQQMQQSGGQFGPGQFAQAPQGYPQPPQQAGASQGYQQPAYDPNASFGPAPAQPSAPGESTDDLPF